LADLINFRFATLTLQIDFLLNASFPEHMVTASDTLFKSQVQQQPA
jgi:hypothetical protein